MHTPHKAILGLSLLALLLTAACGQQSEESTCGNGILDANEACDPAVTEGEGICPSAADCDDGDPCTAGTLEGSADSCTAACVHQPISECSSGDGCCPEGCTEEDDDDCAGEGVPSGEDCPCEWWGGPESEPSYMCDECEDGWCHKLAFAVDAYCTKRCMSHAECHEIDPSWTCNRVCSR